MPNEWYYKLTETVFGPVTPQQLLSLAQSGTIQQSTLVRKGNDGEWVTANRVKGLFADAQVST